MMLMLAGAWQGQRDPHCDLLLRKGTCIVLFGKGAAAPPLGGAPGRSGSSKEAQEPQNCGSRKLVVWQLGIFAPIYVQLMFVPMLLSFLFVYSVAFVVHSTRAWPLPITTAPEH